MTLLIEVRERTPQARALAKRTANRLAWVALVAVGLVIAAWFYGTTNGYRTLVVQSGSMAPTIHAGDLIVTRMIEAEGMKTGDIVTFKDPTRGGRLVTHRIVDLEVNGGQVNVITKGDSNGGVERWSVDREGSVGTLSMRFPRVGYAIDLLRGSGVRLSLAMLGIVLTIPLFRRIWRAG